MSTAVAYPPSHSSARPPSNPDAHRSQSSSSPRNYQNIAPARRSPSNNSMHQQKTSSTTPTRPSSTLAPRPASETNKSGSQGPPALSISQGDRVSPQTSKSSLQVPNVNDISTSNSSQIVIPSVEVKTEGPPTPDAAQSATTATMPPRHRPRKLDLTTNVSVPPGRPSATMTSKDSAPLTAMQDIALSCLSPGFQTEDPRMSQQLQRSMDLREQQRQIIESRLQKGGKDASEPNGSKTSSEQAVPQTSTFSKHSSSKRKGPPPGLTIKAPSAHQFASQPRVIQSAPLGQSFTGLSNKPGSSQYHPLSRQVHESSSHHRRALDQPPSTQATSSSQQYAPLVSTPQTATRLPPIQDMFANENLGSSPYRPSHTLNRANSGPGPSSNGQLYAPITAAGNTSNRSPNPASDVSALPSPAYPPPPQSAGLHPPSHNRERDFRSADEAVHVMAGGRDDMRPKMVHYGGHQPPTPPSPLPPGYPSQSGDRQYQTSSSLRAAEAGAESRSGSGRRRTRDEYERDYDARQGRDVDRMDVDGEQRERGRASGANEEATAPGQGGLGFGFGAWSAEDARRRSPETMRRKKEEFISLCSRAWDLLHE